MALYSSIKEILSTIEADRITKERKETLQPLIDYIQQKTETKEDIRLQFICTHNSRRSHLAQIWAQTWAHYFNIKHIFCYSGGTETTALFPGIIKVLRTFGFRVELLAEGINPIYSIKYSANEPPIIGFSKPLNSSFNPQSKFVAVLTCSQADNDCPLVKGAEQRLLLPYEDPKHFDNTVQEDSKYEAISLQIATELFYTFSQINR